MTDDGIAFVSTSHPTVRQNWRQRFMFWLKWYSPLSPILLRGVIETRWVDLPAQCDEPLDTRLYSLGDFRGVGTYSVHCTRNADGSLRPGTWNHDQ